MQLLVAKWGCWSRFEHYETRLNDFSNMLLVFFDDRFLLGNKQLRAKVQVDALEGEMQTTPLFWAALHNQIYAVELLLRNGADPNFRDGLGFSPFLVAIHRCFPITAAYLVAKGTDVNQRMQGE